MFLEKKNIDKNKLQQVISLVAVELIVFGIKYFVIRETIPFTDIMDEVASLAVPAFLAGYQWEDCMMSASYYGFGFNILFTPLFYFRLDIQIIYKVILIVTAAIEGIIPLIVQYICLNYFKMKNRISILLISILTSFITVNPLYNLINEHILIVMLWIEVFILFKLIYAESKTECRKYSLVLASVLIYGTFIHTRNITIIIATCIGIVLYRGMYKKWIVDRFFFMVLFGGYVGADYVVKYVQTLIWGGTEIVNANVNVSMPNIINLSGFIRGFGRIIGGNLGTIAFFYKAFAYFFLFAIIYYIYVQIKEKVDNKQKQFQAIVIVTIIFSLALGATLLILGIKYFDGLQDVFVNKNVWGIKASTYLRYYILYTSPLCLISCFLLVEYSVVYEKINKAAFIVTVSGLVAWVLHIGPIVENTYFGVSSFYPFSCMVGETGKLNISDFEAITIILIHLACLIFILIKKKKRNMLLGILTILLIHQYIYLPHNYSIPVATSFYDEIDQTIEYLEEQEMDDLYVNDKRGLLIYMYQAYFYQIPVKKYDIKKIKKGDIIVSNEKLDELRKISCDEFMIDKNEWIYVRQ